MSDLTIIWWRDIPTQISFGKGRKATKHQLANRFMVAVDKAAMHADATDSDAYLEDWRRTTSPFVGEDHVQAIQKLALELETQYPTSRLAELAKNGGKQTIAE